MAPINLSDARLEREWKHGSPLIGCRFDPSGRFLFASAQDNSVQRFDLLTGAKTALAGHASWVRGMACAAGPARPVSMPARFTAALGSFSALPSAVAAAAAAVPPPQPFTLISADYHGQLIWWQGEADSPKPTRTVSAHDGWARAVAVSPDGKLVASCGNDHLVKLWSVADGSPVRTLTGHDSHVYNVAFHPDGTHLASADLHGIVKDWDVATGACVRELDAKILHKYDTGFMADIGGARGMAFAADGRLACAGITNVSNAFAGVGNPLVVVFDWKDGKSKQLKPKDAFQGTAWGVAFHPEGFVIAAGGGSGGRVWFWKGDDLASAHTLTVPAGCRDMSLSPTGERFAVAGANGSAFVYTFTPGPAPAPAAPKK
jgi:WD40 repeat protein